MTGIRRNLEFWWTDWIPLFLTSGSKIHKNLYKLVCGKLKSQFFHTKLSTCFKFRKGISQRKSNAFEHGILEGRLIYGWDYVSEVYDIDNSANT